MKDSSTFPLRNCHFSALSTQTCGILKKWNFSLKSLFPLVANPYFCHSLPLEQYILMYCISLIIWKTGGVSPQFQLCWSVSYGLKFSNKELLFWAYQSSSAVAPPKYATQCGKLRQKYAHASIPLGGDEKALEDEKERRERGKWNICLGFVSRRLRVEGVGATTTGFSDCENTAAALWGRPRRRNWFTAHNTNFLKTWPSKEELMSGLVNICVFRLLHQFAQCRCSQSI